MTPGRSENSDAEVNVKANFYGILARMKRELLGELHQSREEFKTTVFGNLSFDEYQTPSKPKKWNLLNTNLSLLLFAASKTGV